jgi:hypothetical protein
MIGGLYTLGRYITPYVPICKEDVSGSFSKFFDMVVAKGLWINLLITSVNEHLLFPRGPLMVPGPRK